jgi:Kef-type K+ transport system membrane component KefB
MIAREPRDAQRREWLPQRLGVGSAGFDRAALVLDEPSRMALSPELEYMLLVFGLFIVPRALQRFRLPSAVTCVVIGAAMNIGFHLFHEDATVRLLATLGIVSMFLFAGLEVDFAELKQGRKVLLQHVGAQLLLLALGGVLIHFVFGLGLRAALLFALALFTPSTGFILDSLHQLGLTDEERFWVKSKAIASELVALGVLFVTIQSSAIGTLSLSAVVLVGMVLVLPPLFRVFARVIAPTAPRTEFTFLIIVALLCAFVTRELGVYYLVGAFIVGLTAVRLRKDLPALSSERLLSGVELFASFFIPFYFFKAGLHLRAEHFTWTAFGIAAGLLLFVVPLRVVRVALHRRMALRERLRVSSRIGIAVVPTLVFTVVIAEILEEKFALRPELFGALIIFTLVNTTLPGYLLRTPAPEYETPEVPRTPEAGAEAIIDGAEVAEEIPARSP